MEPHGCFLVFVAIPIWILSAYFLKKSVSITNEVLHLNRTVWEGSTVSPPRLRRPILRPSFGHAMLVVFISWLFVFGTYFAAGIAFGLTIKGVIPLRLFQLLLIPIVFVVRAWVVGHLLTTTFSRGCLITLIHDLIQFVVIVVPLIVLLHLTELR